MYVEALVGYVGGHAIVTPEAGVKLGKLRPLGRSDFFNS